MNLKQQLKKMNESDLRFICKELGISYSKNKSNVINKLLKPLNREYKMNFYSKRQIRKVKDSLQTLLITLKTAKYDRKQFQRIDNTNIMGHKFVKKTSYLIKILRHLLKKIPNNDPQKSYFAVEVTNAISRLEKTRDKYKIGKQQGFILKKR